MKRRITTIIMGLLVLVPEILALGLTTTTGDTISMQRGEKMIIPFILQNMVGGKDIDTKVEIIEGQEIASLIDGKSIYTVPYGRKDIPINIQLAAPDNPKREYTVRFTITTIEPRTANQLVLAIGLEKRFKVIVEESLTPEEVVTPPQVPAEAPTPQVTEEQPRPQRKELQTVGIAILLIIIIIILYKLVKKHKEKYNRDKYTL